MSVFPSYDAVKDAAHGFSERTEAFSAPQVEDSVVHYTRVDGDKISVKIKDDVMYVSYPPQHHELITRCTEVYSHAELVHMFCLAHKKSGFTSIVLEQTPNHIMLFRVVDIELPNSITLYPHKPLKVQMPELSLADTRRAVVKLQLPYVYLIEGEIADELGFIRVREFTFEQFCAVFDSVGCDCIVLCSDRLLSGHLSSANSPEFDQNLTEQTMKTYGITRAAANAVICERTIAGHVDFPNPDIMSIDSLANHLADYPAYFCHKNA